jgi:serine/threonine protein kinase/tetratricopeptide (TPR) repeat protein
MTPEPSTATDRLLTADRCRRLRDEFDRLLDLPSEQREPWLQSAVADPEDRDALRMLVAADSTDGPLEVPVEQRLQQVLADAGSTARGLVGQLIGAYRLHAVLGQGGSSIVFLARREGVDFEQQVALKLLRRGLYSALEHRLFRREQQLLASLSHPNIAHLIDGGINQAGIPYLVLEYVDGVPLTQYARDRALPVAERLRLLVLVCDAVAAAHRQLIVHRDLKPSNILVTAAGDVKLLDFGVAKLLDDGDVGATGTGAVPLTPGYAAPEQVAGATVTTAADVYSLGVVLHELLVGERPTSGSEHTPPSRRRTGRRPARPEAGPDASAAAVAQLRGDLDTIVLKALAPEPGQRYQAASELGDDLRRHLAGLPVRAHPPSRRYRAGKFIRRHRASVVLAAAVVLSLVLGLGLALWQAAEASREAERARAEAVRATSTRDFIELLFEPVREQVAAGRMPGLRELVAAGPAQLDAKTDLAPEHRIDLLLMFVHLHDLLAEREQALRLAERAHALAQAQLPARSPLRMQGVLQLGRARLRIGDTDGAAPLLREVERWQAEQGVGGPDAIELQANLARLENESGRFDSALIHARREFDARMAMYGPDSANAATAHNNLGYALEALGRFDEAIVAYQRALDLDDRYAGHRDQQRVAPLGNLAQTLFNAGRLSEARPRLAEVQALYADAGFERPPRGMLGSLAILLETDLALGRLDSAAGLAAHYTTLAALSPPTDRDRANATVRAARVAFERGDHAAARDALAGLDDQLAPLDAFSQSRVGAWRSLILAELALVQGRAGDAVPLAQATVDGFGSGMYPPYAIAYARALRDLACAEAAADAPACAGAAGEALPVLLDRPPNDRHPALLPAHVALARIELRRGEAAAAMARIERAIGRAIAGGVEAQAPRVRQAQAWHAAAAALSGACEVAQRSLQASRTAPSAGAPAHPLVAQAWAAWPKDRCARTRA